jgi:hypothetical protein
MANPPRDFKVRIESHAKALLNGEAVDVNDAGALSKSAGFSSYKIIKVSPSERHYHAEIKFMGARKEKTVVVKLDASAQKILAIGPRPGGTGSDDDEDEPEETRTRFEGSDSRPDAAC